MLLIFFYLLSATSVPPKTPEVKPAIAPHRSTACSLVSRSDVEQALGRLVDSGTEETKGPISTCDYTGSKSLVSITVQQLTDKLDLDSEIAHLKKEIPEGAARSASGFDDGSFFFDIPGAGTQLHILIGNRRHLMVSILGFGEPHEISGAAERIARRAISRLQ